MRWKTEYTEMDVGLAIFQLSSRRKWHTKVIQLKCHAHKLIEKFVYFADECYTLGAILALPV
jgi:hypothetical protein